MKEIMILSFKVYAGSMLVGRLHISGSLHLFTDISGRIKLNNGASERVSSFKKLKLIRK